MARISRYVLTEINEAAQRGEDGSVPNPIPNPSTMNSRSFINARTDFARRLYGRPEGGQSRKSTPLKVTVNLWWLRRIRATGH